MTRRPRDATARVRRLAGLGLAPADVSLPIPLAQGETGGAGDLVR